MLTHWAITDHLSKLSLHRAHTPSGLLSQWGLLTSYTPPAHHPHSSLGLNFWRESSDALWQCLLIGVSVVFFSRLDWSDLGFWQEEHRNGYFQFPTLFSWLWFEILPSPVFLLSLFLIDHILSSFGFKLFLHSSSLHLDQSCPQGMAGLPVRASGWEMWRGQKETSKAKGLGMQNQWGAVSENMNQHVLPSPPPQWLFQLCPHRSPAGASLGVASGLIRGDHTCGQSAGDRSPWVLGEGQQNALPSRLTSQLASVLLLCYCAVW